jgi:hypothetical protein
MRNLLVIGTIAVLLGAVAAGVAFGGDATTSEPTAKRQVARFTRTLDAPAATGRHAPRHPNQPVRGRMAVDLRTSLDPGFPRGARVRRGPFTGFCVAAAETYRAAECQLTYAAPEGRIAAVGHVSGGRTRASLTIVGGTRRYAGAGGRVGVAPGTAGDVNARFVVLLAPPRRGGGGR